VRVQVEQVEEQDEKEGHNEDIILLDDEPPDIG
jgi:hypothetical protein